jgi:uncharacterized Fe-S cluster-containing radical SAM superfamily protein
MAVSKSKKRNPMLTKNGKPRLGPLNLTQLNDMLEKSAELKRIDAMKNTRVNIVQDSSLEKGLVKSIPNVKFESPLVEIEEIVEIIETRKFVLEINGMKKSLEPGEYTLGRGTEVDIQIQDPGISRKHLVIIVEDKVIVKDLNSTNGTYINGESITEIEVEEQITFRVGVTEIRIASEIQ